MKTAKSNGFILTMVIVFLGLMGVVLLVLTEGTQTMLSQTDRMYLAAVENNLASSGAAWASAQLSADRLTLSDPKTELDGKLLSDRACSLSVRVMSRTGNQADVRVSTSCSKARWTLSHSHAYELSTR